MTACLCHSASERAKQNNRLTGTMNPCSIRLTQLQGEGDSSFFTLVGATGGDGKIRDIDGLERTALHRVEMRLRSAATCDTYALLPSPWAIIITFVCSRAYCQLMLSLVMAMNEASIQMYSQRENRKNSRREMVLLFYFSNSTFVDIALLV